MQSGSIGFVHYKFCWFRMDGECTKTADNASEGSYGIVSLVDKLKKGTPMELVLHIESIQCKSHETDGNKGKEGNPYMLYYDNTPALILISLALEHAREHGIWYGMLETSVFSVQFFKQFFCMNQIQNSCKQDDSKNETGLLACDLKSCSYRYAFLLKKEIQDGTKSHSESGGDVVIKERLLCVPRIHPTLNKRLKPNPSILCHNSMKPDINICSYFGRNASTKHIKVRLEIPTTETDIVDFISKGEKVNDAIVVTIQSQPRDSKKLANECDVEKEEFFKHLNWDILRCFTVHPIDKSQSRSKLPKEGENMEGDAVFNKLNKLQKELITLESAMIPKVRCILKQSYEERKKYEDSKTDLKSSIEEQTLKQYDNVLRRRREAERAWSLQLEQDLDAVCDICNDGEVTKDNQIIFCESCNVAVHQQCYAIHHVPSGDYFCHPCRYFKRDKDGTDSTKLGTNSNQNHSPDPICCELCPIREGAFVKTFSKKSKTKEPKWVHVLCAKWQGFRFVDEKLPDTVEDVTLQKNFCRLNDFMCCLCKGIRGTFNLCNEDKCNNMMHVMCAQKSGICNMYHGQNHTGDTESPKAWTLYCPDHSRFATDYIKPADSLTLDQLIDASKSFPLEPKPEPPPKPFEEMNAKERNKYFSCLEDEQDFFKLIKKKNVGMFCQVCDEFDQSSDLLKCAVCNAVVHNSCFNQDWISKNIGNTTYKICKRCVYIAENNNTVRTEGFELPSCHMCNDRNGILLKAMATPLNKRKWEKNKAAYKRTLFARQLWCHPVCSM